MSAKYSWRKINQQFARRLSLRVTLFVAALRNHVYQFLEIYKMAQQSASQPWLWFAQGLSIKRQWTYTPIYKHKNDVPFRGRYGLAVLRSFFFLTIFWKSWNLLTCREVFAISEEVSKQRNLFTCREVFALSEEVSKHRNLLTCGEVFAISEISETEITFLDTKVYKGDRFNKESILDVQTHYKPTETFQYTNFYSCHPPIKVLRLLISNCSQSTFEENICNSVRITPKR